jgi:O-antigen/teichoic acid export membrane protein
MKKLLSSILRLGTGEAVSRLASFGLYAYISRAFGIELLGIVALSQTIATYVTLGTDQGLRMIGARLVARDPSAAPEIMRHVLRRRLTSCAICVALGVLYAVKGPVPANARYYILGFVLGVIPYSFSLDWLAWGLARFGWLGAWRGGTNLLFVVSAVVAIHVSRTTLLPLTVANAASAALGAVFLWALWIFQWRVPNADAQSANNELENHFRWNVVLPLGMATIFNLMFNNFDTVILGALVSAKEVGRYNAAYKILFVIFGGFYLVTQSLYPKLSRAGGGKKAKRMFAYTLVALSLLGIGLAGMIAIWSGSILGIIYGSDVNAIYLLRVLSLAIPMDFCVALMGTVLVSQGFDKSVLWGAGFAAMCNILVNLWLIPRHGAEGAAWTTVLSYLILLIVLGKSCLTATLFREVELTSDTMEAVGNTA